VAIGVNWAEVWKPVWKAVWTQTPPVEVPDVVGDTQAAGTLELETALFVVSVTTAYSPSVALGLIISQDPIGGTFAASGSTVEIVVSLGPEPVVVPPSAAEESSGGWAFHNAYDLELRRRRKRKKEQEELEAETERIEDELDRNIAQLMREQEAIDAKREDLNRLKELAQKHADLEAARQYSERVATAFARALAQGNFSAMEALDRELQRARDDEDLMTMAAHFFLMH
jgi:hypothetical protein